MQHSHCDLLHSKVQLIHSSHVKCYASLHRLLAVHHLTLSTLQEPHAQHPQPQLLLQRLQRVPEALRCCHSALLLLLLLLPQALLLQPLLLLLTLQQHSKLPPDSHWHLS
jgi:hypothetical protein